MIVWSRQDAPDFVREAAGRLPPGCAVRLRLVQKLDRELFGIERSDAIRDRAPHLEELRLGLACVALEDAAGVKVERDGIVQAEEQDDLLEHLVEIGFALPPGESALVEQQPDMGKTLVAAAPEAARRVGRRLSSSLSQPGRLTPRRMAASSFGLGKVSATAQASVAVARAGGRVPAQQRGDGTERRRESGEAGQGARLRAVTPNGG